MASPERQVQLVVQDVAGFVNRGLAILWRDATADVAARYSEACALIDQDQLAALGQLLHAHPDLLQFRAADEEGFQLLHYAASRGSLECVGLLIEQGAPLDAPSGHVSPGEEHFLPGASPLLVAADKSRTEIACALLAAGADANAVLPASRETALHLAAAKGLEVLTEALLEAGAAPDELSDRHSFDDQLGLYRVNTPLHAAALNNRAEVLRILLKAGADRDACGVDQRRPLHYAAARGCVAALEVLLAAGADPDVRDHCEMDGVATHMAALHYAVLNDHTASVAMLLCYGADPCLTELSSGESAVQMAESCEDPQLSALLARGLRGEAGDGVFSHLDDQYITCMPSGYAEVRDFLYNQLAEFPVGSKSLLVLSDWLAEMLGADNRPHLARAYRERLARGAN